MEGGVAWRRTQQLLNKIGEEAVARSWHGRLGAYRRYDYEAILSILLYLRQHDSRPCP